jgi:osmoprotectant transport system ATP-binding protein
VLEQYATPAELLAHPANQFVEDFLGEGRLVRRLALIRVRDVKLIPLNGATPPAISVDADASLRDALDAVLRADDGRAGVVDGDAVMGVVNADVIRQASR